MSLFLDSFIDKRFTMLPNFLFIGPAKSASTWFFEILRSHPQIYVPPCKDIYFFDRYYGKGVGWYSKHFPSDTGAVAIGELSHDYLFSEDACERIGKILPGVKLIACLRDPVDRFFSDYLFTKKHGLVAGDIFEALEVHPEILQHCFYYPAVKRYLDRFGSDHILILDFSEIEKDPDSVVEKVYRFLGVDPKFKPEIANEVVLPAAFARNTRVAFWGKMGAEWLRKIGLINLLGRLKRSRLVNALLYETYTKENYPKLSIDDRKKIFNLLKEDIDSLETLLQMHFESWHLNQ